MNADETRRRGLNFVRRQIAAGKATKKDLDRWAEEIGDEVRQIARDVAPPKSAPPAVSKPATTKES